MIDVTRLNGHRLVLNCDLIKFAEATPDTTLTLLTGEKLIIRESCDQLIHLTAAWRARIRDQHHDQQLARTDAALAHTLSVRNAHQS